MTKHKHLTQEQRCRIATLLNGGHSFKYIGNDIGKDCTTISKEIKRSIVFRKTGGYGRPYNPCSKRFTCDKRLLCEECKRKHKNSFCKFCGNCIYICEDFREELCKKHSKAPYVCNGCPDIKKCTLEKRIYSGTVAYNEYKNLLSEARTGITYSEDEVSALEKKVSPLIRKGQSLHHIVVNNQDSLMVSQSTLYRLVDYNLFSARNIDLPRKVRFRKRRKSKTYKVDRKCRIGRTYEDYLSFRERHPDLPTIEIDTVEGKKGGKVLLTIHFEKVDFMIAYIRKANDSQSVIDIIDRLYLELRSDIFMDLCPIFLADRGSEFTNPLKIEFDGQGNRRTRIFYCDPSSPHQRGSSEGAHTFIRRFIPKGKSLDQYTQEDISLMMNHINSHTRKGLGNKCAYDAFALIYGKRILDILGCERIKANDVILNNSIFSN